MENFQFGGGGGGEGGGGGGSRLIWKLSEKNNIRFGGDRLPLVCFAVYEVVFAAASRCQQVIGSLSNDSRERGEQRAEYPAMHSFCYFSFSGTVVYFCISVFLCFRIFTEGCGKKQTHLRLPLHTSMGGLHIPKVWRDF